ncbi:MAG: peroxide stress protein YaaA, partial [Demequinaceae bacterium]|nr:peroxide stress protein YaaA [Demequinaceae bacterium]
MLILLPPSEGKSFPTMGSPVALSSLSHPELSDTRRRVGDALVRLSGTRGALAALGVGASLAEDVRHNTTLWENPSAPAATVYAGVLYEAAQAALWDSRMLARANERIRIISALWGALSPTDKIPAYRLSMATSMPRLGGLAALWRRQLDAALSPLAGEGVVVDCRSSPYVSAWSAIDAPWVAIKVLRDRDGSRTVVSHMAKHTRGLLTAHLLTLETVPQSPSDVA